MRGFLLSRHDAETLIADWNDSCQPPWTWRELCHKLDDAERVEFLSEALRGLHACIADGVDVRGYFVWSLLDSYEWHRGYHSNLGLFSVDRRTFERRAKPSASWYASVARSNTLIPVD